MIASGFVAATDSQAGPIGLALVVVLGIAVAFLGRSMSKHLAKVPKSFDQPAEKPVAEKSAAESVSDSETDDRS